MSKGVKEFILVGVISLIILGMLTFMSIRPHEVLQQRFYSTGTYFTDQNGSHYYLIKDLETGVVYIRYSNSVCPLYDSNGNITIER